MDLRSGQSVLDVAAGNGNASLAAARRFCKVVSTDYVPSLLEQSRIRAAAEKLAVDYREADAEALPFANASFDNVVSTFGVMFAPNQGKAASELIRVCKKGGKIGLTNWTPDGFIGQLFKTVGRHVPPPAGVSSPAAWGTEAFLEEHFSSRVSKVDVTLRHSIFAITRRNTGSISSALTTGRAEGVRVPRRGSPGVPAPGPRAVDRAPQPGHRRHNGRTVGLPRDRDFRAVTGASPMDAFNVREAQAPLRAKYRTAPETALVVDRARTSGKDAAIRTIQWWNRCPAAGRPCRLAYTAHLAVPRRAHTGRHPLFSACRLPGFVGSHDCQPPRGRA